MPWRSREESSAKFMIDFPSSYNLGKMCDVVIKDDNEELKELLENEVIRKENDFCELKFESIKTKEKLFSPLLEKNISPSFNNRIRQILLNDNPNCENFKNTDILISALKIGGSINRRKCRCYCDDCQLKLGISNSWFIRRGNPIEKASLPLGWSRYALRLSQTVEAKVNTWHISYHGTTHHAIPHITRDMQLKIPDNTSIFIRQGHIPNQFYMFTSPSIFYASFGLYASPFQIKGDNRWWQAAVEILQKPHTYIKEWETSGLGTVAIDINFRNNEIEWKSCTHNSTLVRAILVREIPNKEPPICCYPLGTYFRHEKDWWYQPYDGSPPFLPKCVKQKCECGIRRCKRQDNICPFYETTKKFFEKAVNYRDVVSTEAINVKVKKNETYFNLMKIDSKKELENDDIYLASNPTLKLRDATKQINDDNNTGRKINDLRCENNVFLEDIYINIQKNYYNYVDKKREANFFIEQDYEINSLNEKNNDKRIVNRHSEKHRNFPEFSGLKKNLTSDILKADEILSKHKIVKEFYKDRIEKVMYKYKGYLTSIDYFEI